jgi:hypothetical protein
MGLTPWRAATWKRVDDKSDIIGLKKSVDRAEWWDLILEGAE